MAKKKHTSRLTSTSRKANIGTLDQQEVKRRREAKGMSQAEAAKLAGFKSAIQWWDIENKPNRDPRVSTVAAVARSLGCKVDQLLRK